MLQPKALAAEASDDECRAGADLVRAPRRAARTGYAVDEKAVGLGVGGERVSLSCFRYGKGVGRRRGERPER